MSSSNDTPSVFIGLVALAGVSGALACWGYQIYWYAQHGDWLPISVIRGLYFFHQSEWLYSPSSWVGIHKILDAINAGFAALIASTLLVWAIAVSDN